MPDASREQAAPQDRRRSAWRLIWTISAVALRVVLLATLAICAASPELIHLDWRFDIVASLLAQVCLVGCVVSIWQAAFGRWVWCAVFAVVTAAGFSWMLGVERAPTAGSAATGTGVSILVMNVHSRNERDEAIFTVIEDADADLVVIVESSWKIIRTLPGHPPLLERYPYRDGVDANSSGQIIVLSKHPLTRSNDNGASPGLASSWGYRAGYVDLGGERIRFAAVHAPSPRTRATWGYGQHTFTRLAQHFERIGGPMGSQPEPIIVAGDLNSSPTGVRSRLVTENLGLRRAKPVRVWDGTYPASLPWFARSSIDGAFVSPGISVRSWTTVRIPGSDHRGVFVSLDIEARSGD